MSDLKQIVADTRDFKAFAHAYGQYVARLLGELDLPTLERLALELETARKDGATIFVAGNGGSAGTASHMANDLAFGVRRHVDPPLRVMALADNMPVVTALSNDVGYEQIFLRQLQVYYRPGDKLLVISASGNSLNLVVAAEWVKARAGKVMGFLGFDGGKLKDLCDIPLIVRTPKGEYGPVEDVHMILDHLLYTWLWSKARS